MCFIERPSSFVQSAFIIHRIYSYIHTLYADLSSTFSFLGREGGWSSLGHGDVERLHQSVIEMVALHYLLVEHHWGRKEGGQMVRGGSANDERGSTNDEEKGVGMMRERGHK